MEWRVAREPIWDYSLSMIRTGVKTPMKRTNSNKGRDEDPMFVPISWDEALDTIADKNHGAAG